MGVTLSDKIEKIYPLAPLQEGLYFLKMKEDSSSEYVIQNVIEIEGNVTSEIIRDAFRLISLNFDILRTVFSSDSTGRPIQIVLKDRYIECNCIDFSSFQDEELRNKIDRASEENIKRGFNFKSDSLMRVTIIKTAADKFTLLWTFHHIILDGWSLGILNNCFKEYINKLLCGESFEIIRGRIESERKYQPEYSNYIKWLENKPFAIGEDYWTSYLEDYNEVVDIKPYGGSSKDNPAQTESEINLSAELTAEVIRTADCHHITHSEIFETCWGIILQQFSNTQDAVFGKVVSGRNANVSGAEQIAGLFINTIPTRIDCRNNPTINNLLQNVHENSLRSSDYDYVPLSEIQSYSKQGSNLIRSIYTYENYYSHPDESVSCIKLVVKESREQTNYDISLLIYKDSTFHVKLMYNSHMYSQLVAENILNKFINVVQFIVSNTEKRICEITLTDDDEKQKLLHVFNEPALGQDSDDTITKIFKEVVNTYEDKDAVIFKDERITYKILDESSNKIANYLVHCGVLNDDYVGLICDRGIHMIISMLGIIKAGAAYVPIDPTFPQKRIDYIIEDCKPKMILTTIKEAALSINTINIKEILLGEKESNYSNKIKLKNNNLAYLIYTSGTTGKPKGVAVEHKGVVNLNKFFRNSFNVTSKDNVLQFANYVFDASVWEITMALLTGATLVIAPNEYINDIEKLEIYCEENRVTVATLPPQFYIQISKLNTRLLITAGSESNEEIIHKALESGRYVNAYGPTETTVCATYYEQQNDLDTIIPIGKPIDNTQAYILIDKTLCGIGIPGELCIAGIGLAREYLNSDQLTQEKFINNPFGAGKLYRTGDLARWLLDGNIEYLGRIDDQIKIRGFRIEPGEIENAIRKINGIIDVAVTTQTVGNGEDTLAAFVVSEIEIDVDKIKSELRTNLPNYMLPDFILSIDKIPVTRSGKLDKLLLPQIETICSAEYVAPSDEREENLCKCFEAALKVNQIGICDNIFDFGATSLTIIKVVLKAAKIGINLTIQNIYDNPTVKLLGDFLKNDEHKNYFVDNPDEYAKLNYLLKNNVVKNTYIKPENRLKDVLITGGTGFLGAHIVAELLLQIDCNIYCIVRGKTLTESVSKFNHSINYYFENRLNDYIKDRVTILCADITDDDIAKKLPSYMDCVIHVAADIKHFGKKEDFYNTNVLGTKNMLEYASLVNSQFAYISTSSVSGNVFEDNDAWEFSERDFFLNQFFISPYMQTKFDAERLVLEANQAGLDSYIIRVGNLTNRFTDGMTMRDLDTNRFYSLVNAYIELGYISDSILENGLEFSPVDITAKGVLVLLKAHERKNTVYHLFNSKKVATRELINVLNKYGYKFEEVAEDVLMEKLHNTLGEKDRNRIYEAITRTDVYDLEKPVKLFDLKTDFTDWVLAHNGFIWNEISDDYLEKVINYWAVRKLEPKKSLI